MAKFVDLFCGCGGASLGLLRAGLKHKASYDINDDAIASYLSLTGHHATKLDLSSARLENLIDGSDIVWVSSPCQSISGAKGGKRYAEDSPGIILFESVINQLLPLNSWIIVENSMDLIKFPQTETICNKIMQTRGFWFDENFLYRSVLSCADYGVPQSRLRLFWAIPPKGRRPLSFEESKIPVISRPTFAVIRNLKDHDPEYWPINAYESGMTKSVPKNTWGDLPKTVLASRMIRVKDGRYTHPEYNRRLTIGENTALQCLPPIKLTGNVASRYCQVGNAVPPPISEMIGRKILEQEEIFMKTGKTAKATLDAISDGAITIYEPNESCSANVAVRPRNSYVAVIVPKVSATRTMQHVGRAIRTKPAPKVVASFPNAKMLASQPLSKLPAAMGLQKKAKRATAWTRQEVVLALGVYLNKNRDRGAVRKLAKRLSRSTGAVTWKFSNLRKYDPTTNAIGAISGSKVDKEVFQFYMKDKKAFAKEFTKAWGSSNAMIGH